jgi:hypothetical protein
MLPPPLPVLEPGGPAIGVGLPRTAWAELAATVTATSAANPTTDTQQHPATLGPDHLKRQSATLVGWSSNTSGNADAQNQRLIGLRAQ